MSIVASVPASATTTGNDQALTMPSRRARKWWSAQAWCASTSGVMTGLSVAMATPQLSRGSASGRRRIDFRSASANPGALCSSSSDWLTSTSMTAARQPPTTRSAVRQSVRMTFLNETPLAIISRIFFSE